MEKIGLTEYMEIYPFSQEVYSKVIKDKILGERIDVKIFYEDIMFNNKRSRMVIFANGTLSAIGIDFKCSINANDLIGIAKCLFKEYIDAIGDKDILYGGFSENENGEVYFSYDREGKERYDLLGYDFIDTNRKWNSKYGFKSKAHKQYVHDRIIDKIDEYIQINGDDKSYVADLLEYVKMYSSEECKDLFK